MAAFNFFDSFTTEMTQGTHTACIDTDVDTLKVYLTNTSPSASTHTVRGDLTEIANGNGYTTNGIDTLNAATTSANVTSVDGTDDGWTAAGGVIAEFQYVVLYNDTQLDKLIGWWDYGSKVNLADTQSFNFTFGTEMFKVGATS